MTYNIITVCPENGTIHISTLRWQNVEFFFLMLNIEVRTLRWQNVEFFF